MEGIGKYLGAIILLVGVLVLAIPAFTNSISDKSLMIGLFFGRRRLLRPHYSWP
ncbi:hypothetical protein [Porphyromonas gingivalis]|uniref:hypothetical protein n=1 Tax=Porphyromonas gingivalis TaxID=837 RepID=UPI000A7AE1E5|nr:hypothetical protein [Porphyromonas gingivalis]